MMMVSRILRPAARAGRTLRAVAVFSVLMADCLFFSGCRYCTNRSADFRDIFQAGVGVTAENSKTGFIPPAMGIFMQFTDFLNLGWVGFSGKTMEMDGRGFFMGTEPIRMRWGLLFWQGLRIRQDYDRGRENYFKKSATQWAKRMNSRDMRCRWLRSPAKQLNYEPFEYEARNSVFWNPRGWQYWENISMESTFCDMYLTHLGFDLRLGLDVSEVSDFILGIFGCDFKRDDLTREEYAEARGGRATTMETTVRPPSD